MTVNLRKNRKNERVANPQYPNLNNEYFYLLISILLLPLYSFTIEFSLISINLWSFKNDYSEGFNEKSIWILKNRLVAWTSWLLYLTATRSPKERRKSAKQSLPLRWEYQILPKEWRGDAETWNKVSKWDLEASRESQKPWRIQFEACSGSFD